MIERDDGPFCEECGAELEFEECWNCHGEGEFDCYDDDPINYAPGQEFELCYVCAGKQFLAYCPWAH